MKNFSIFKYNRISKKILTSIVILFLMFFIFLSFYESRLNDTFNKIHPQYTLDLNSNYDHSNNITIKQVFNRLSIINAKINTPFSLHKKVKFNKWYDMKNHSQDPEYLKNIDILFKDAPDLKIFSKLLQETEGKVMSFSDNSYIINKNKDFFRNIEELFKILINDTIKKQNFKIALKRYEQYLTFNLIRNTYFLDNPDFGKRAFPKTLISLMFFNKETLNKLEDHQIKDLFDLTRKASKLKPSLKAIITEYKNDYNNKAKTEFRNNPLYFSFKELITEEFKSYNEIFDLSLEFLQKNQEEKQKEIDSFITKLENINTRKNYYIEYNSIIIRLIKKSMENGSEEIKKLSFSL